MTRRDRAKRFSIKYRANDPHEPHWVVRVESCPLGVPLYRAIAPGRDRARDYASIYLPDVLDYARHQQPAHQEVPC